MREIATKGFRWQLTYKNSKTMIREALPGAEVEIVDEGGGDHLRAIVRAAQFEGQSRINQHRMVKEAVKPRFDDGSIHALSITSSTPD